MEIQTCQSVIRLNEYTDTSISTLKTTLRRRAAFQPPLGITREGQLYIIGSWLFSRAKTKILSDWHLHLQMKNQDDRLSIQKGTLEERLYDTPR